MKWIESAGGPLVLVSWDDVSMWSGYEGDYEAACAVKDLTGVVRFGDEVDGKSALVIWGEPLATAYLADEKILVQWMYADTEDDLLRMVGHELSAAVWQEGPSITLAHRLVLFDAAVPGDELNADDVLEVELASGVYQIQTTDVASGRRAARLYRLTAT
ncbi:Imm21 family immunity protein [Sphaerisporangium sp. B11E5]|uniref:Imm21 family immunity protein n=1 Tax=Sphaerisporangium sp. B11E5 TaxID=3153563 RepID=UPI00325E6812